MSIGNAILSVLGIANEVNEAESVITASKSAIEMIQAAKELLDSGPGKEFRDRASEIISVSHEKPDGSVHIGSDKPAAHDAPHYAKGHYEFDSINGWVFKPE
jgi:hypothetical protein